MFTLNKLSPRKIKLSPMYLSSILPIHQYLHATTISYTRIPLLYLSYTLNLTTSLHIIFSHPHYTLLQIPYSTFILFQIHISKPQLASTTFLHFTILHYNVVHVYLYTPPQRHMPHYYTHTRTHTYTPLHKPHKVTRLRCYSSLSTPIGILTIICTLIHNPIPPIPHIST